MPKKAKGKRGGDKQVEKKPQLISQKRTLDKKTHQTWII